MNMGAGTSRAAKHSSTSVKQVMVVAPNGKDCVDIDIQAPLRVKPCDTTRTTQILDFDNVSGHLGKAHPMQTGTLYGHININSKTGPGLQFT